MKKFLGSLILSLFSSVFVFSQNQDGKITLPDSITHDNIIISEVKVSGNKLSNDHYIIRELDFKKGDTLKTLRTEDKQRKGMKRVIADSSELNLRMEYRLLIDVNERHYWWLFPVAKLNAPNFNEWLRDPALEDISMGLFFSHNNLFGISHQTSPVGYEGKSYAAVWGYRIPWSCIAGGWESTL